MPAKKSDQKSEPTKKSETSDKEKKNPTKGQKIDTGEEGGGEPKNATGS